MKLSQEFKQHLKAKALGLLQKNSIDHLTNLSVLDRVLNAGERLKSGPFEMKAPKKSALVFADNKPGHNWAHPCEYTFFDTDHGELISTEKATLPPMDFFSNSNAFEAIHTPVTPPSYKKKVSNILSKKRNVLSHFPGNRYAILYSGSSNNRHVNDMEFLYRTLLDIYGYDPANIYVLNFDGTLDYGGGPHPVNLWPGDDTAYRMPVDGPGTQAAFNDVVDDLKTRIIDGDMLFIHTNNHGAGPEDDASILEYCLCAYAAVNWTAFYATDFAVKLAELPTFDVLYVMMEQCRSGGFIDPVIDHSPAKWTHICAAADAAHYSAGGAEFDPFALDWIASVTGAYDDGGALDFNPDTNGDGRISATEAFNYADASNTQGDTPVFEDAPAQCGDHIFLGRPDHDLFIRDNLQDHGLEPLIAGGISSSPDIIVYNQELLDPDATLLTPAAQNKQSLGEPVEHGQDNFIYIRVSNRGTQATSGHVRLYWCPVSTFPTPGSWNFLGETDIPDVPSREMAVVGPIVWDKNDIPAQGHYCFVGLVDGQDDPAPDPSVIHTINDYYQFIRTSNNVTWKNFNVIDMFSNSMTHVNFHIEGWPGESIISDLELDMREVPANVLIIIRLLKRLCVNAQTEHLIQLEESAMYRRYRVSPGVIASFKNLSIHPSDDTQASVEFTLPENMDNGAYPCSFIQKINGMEMGRVTHLLAVGDYPFMANRHTKEIHQAQCKWTQRMSSKNKQAFTRVDKVLNRGYNGCHYCLKEYDTD